MTPSEAVRDHMGLVYMAVGRWLRKHPRLRFYREDLVQDGVEGLLRAAKTYDPTRGPFSPHANIFIFTWTRAAVLRMLGLTTRSVGHCGGSIDVRRKKWRYDTHATDLEGVPLSPDTLPLDGRSPEDAAATAELVRLYNRKVGSLRRRFSARDIDIYTHAVAMDRNTADTSYARGRKNCDEPGSMTVLAKKYGISRERVRQIIGEVTAEVRKWGDSIKAEAA